MMHQTLTIATVACLTAAASAGSIHEWTWSPGDTGVNNHAGVLQSAYSRYDSVNETLSFYAEFGVVPGNPSLTTDGFTLAISPGPNPKGHAGELALLYFDATASTPVLNAYAYNGQNSNTTYRDGSPAGGIQAPDPIISSINDATWYSDLTAETNGGVTTLGFTIDASAIQNHAPQYPGPGGQAEWTGVAFGEHFGIWFHPFAGLETSYKDGFLAKHAFARQGWLDARDLPTQVVPLPPAVAFGGLGLLGVLALRRRKKA